MTTAIKPRASGHTQDIFAIICCAIAPFYSVPNDLDPSWNYFLRAAIQMISPANDLPEGSTKKKTARHHRRFPVLYSNLRGLDLRRTHHSAGIDHSSISSASPPCCPCRPIHASLSGWTVSSHSTDFHLLTSSNPFANLLWVGLESNQLFSDAVEPRRDG